ncbi:MAG: Hsp70 family protein [Pseudomonadota bacterium]
MSAVKRLLGRKLEAPEVRHHRQTVAYDLVGARNGDARVRVGRRHHPPQDIAATLLGALRRAAERQAAVPCWRCLRCSTTCSDRRSATRAASRG